MRYQFFRFLSESLTKAFGAALRAFVTSLAFGAVLISVLHLLGVPLPSAHDLVNGFEGLSRLAKHFS